MPVVVHPDGPTGPYRPSAKIYVDDIIFGSTKKELCEEFEKLMKDKFQMSSMGELAFFLGLQVQQRKKAIFISQDKYVHEILKKFNYTDVKSASTPTDLERPLVKDADADDVDEHLYRSMIGSLMYLTTSRPDIMFAVCACARFQVSPKTSHLLAVKRIFRYLKGKPSLGLWYSKDSPLDKKQTVVCHFYHYEAEYVAAAAIAGTISLDPNQLLYYGHQELTSPEQTATALASPEQTATGKDISNPFIVGSLLKTIWLSLHHVISNEAMASPKQTAIGKDSSNPFMAGSLPKTTLSVNL
ncbi:putative ribonuclease H-like domain-containing protein [Tanacetum coccineum]